MNEQLIEKQYQSIVSLIVQQRLKEAHDAMQSLAVQAGDWLLNNRLDQARTSYNYMLQYLQQGVNDPERQQLYGKLLRDAWETADQLRVKLLQATSNKPYYTKRRQLAMQGNYISLADMLKQHENFVDDLTVSRMMDDDGTLETLLSRHEELNYRFFSQIWTNSAWTADDARQANLFLSSKFLRIHDLCLFTSAVTMSLMECFDSYKLTWLMNAYRHQQVYVSQRALVGITLIFHIYQGRISYYPELTAQLSLLNEDEDFGRQMNVVYAQLLRSQDTEKITQMMREEIIPEMMKNASLLRHMKIDFNEDSDDTDRNPEWKVNPELDKKLREMNEMQLEGADLHMSTFSMLKNNAFFQEIANWFYPFDPEHTAVRKLFKNDSKESLNAFMKVMLHAGFFCESDKYSLCYMMSNVPQQQRDMVVSNITEKELGEIMGDETKINELRQQQEKPGNVCTQYIHDLYRFFKLYQYRNAFRDVFNEDLTLHLVPELRSVLNKPSLLAGIANFHFQYEHYDKAVETFQQIDFTGKPDADIFQKKGYCLQKLRRYAEAIEAYIMADVLKPDNIWTLRHTAACHMMTGNYTEALKLYAKVADVQPESTQIIYLMGQCLAGAGKYEEALQKFYQIDIMDNNNVKAWRAIAWCQFMTSNYEQALKYYDKVLKENPLANDYLNAGHATWVNGDIGQACTLYRMALELFKDKETFRTAFLNDEAYLTAHGIKREDFPLMLDLIQTLRSS